MNFIIEEFSDDSIVLYLRKNENGSVSLVANNGSITNTLLTIKKSGGFARVPYVTLPFIRVNEEGKIEEENL